MLFDLMLMLTPLTGDRLDADRKAYINDLTSLGGYTALGYVLAAVSAVLLILAIVFIVQAIKRRKESSRGGVIKSVVRSVLMFFLLSISASVAGMILVPSLLMRLSFESHETKVVCATIRDKKEREQTVGRRGHKAKGVSYVIFTDDGQEYSVSSEVYAEAEVGGTYYLGTMDGWKNCFAIYDVGEYEYDI